MWLARSGLGDTEAGRAARKMADASRSVCFEGGRAIALHGAFGWHPAGEGSADDPGLFDTRDPL
jgi:hypothetical protein